MNKNEYIQLESEYLAHNYEPLPVIIHKGEGSWLWDKQGNRYLDMMSAYSAVSHGHLHPRIINALCSQAHTLTMTSRAFYNDQLLPLAQKLTKLSNLAKVLPMNTGAEAVETALKAARRWGYRNKGIPHDQAQIIVCNDNFHGRTISIISFSTDKSYRDGFGPYTPGFKAVPFGDVQAFEQAITANTSRF